MKHRVVFTVLLALSATLAAPSFPGDQKAEPQVLITNANVFDGTSEQLATGMSVLVEGNKIAKIALGTDLVGSAESKQTQAKGLSNRLPWFTPAEILKQATANNAELMSWSGPRNPYPGRLGVIEEGAYADLLLVDGNPLQNLHVFDDPGKNLALIMKDGKIFKNAVKQQQ